MGEFIEKVKKYFVLTRAEKNALILSIIIIGFIISFRDWTITPEGKLDFSKTLFNLFNGMIIAALVLLVHESAQRLWAIKTGLKLETKIWWPGLIAGIILAFISRGYLWFIIAPAVFLHHLPVQRLGKFRYGLNMFSNGMICFSGIVAVMGLAIITKVLLVYLPGNLLLQKVLIVSLWFAAVNMLPIPPLDGSRVFFLPGGMLLYIFAFFTVVGLGLFLLLPITNLWMIWLLILGGFIIGIGGWYYYMKQML